MEMILAKIQVRYRLNDDLFIDKGIIPYNRHGQELAKIEAKKQMSELNKFVEYACLRQMAELNNRNNAKLL